MTQITSKVHFLGEMRTEAIHVKSGSKILTDAPIDNHGKGELFSPTDLVATSLASCMMTIMGMAGETHGFSVDGMRADVEKIMGTNPRRIVEIKIQLFFPPYQYSEKEKRIIEKCITECPVAQSLHPDIKQTITYQF